MQEEFSQTVRKATLWIIIQEEAGSSILWVGWATASKLKNLIVQNHQEFITLAKIDSEILNHFYLKILLEKFNSWKKYKTKTWLWVSSSVL